MGRPFIACYKAFRGGEFFQVSLESVCKHTDGAVVVQAEKPWTGDKTWPENCFVPLQQFRAGHPDYPVVTTTVECNDQSEQYRHGLECVRGRFGEDAAVLIVDTDEVWDASMLANLRWLVLANPQHHYFCSRIWSYLKSPLYKVWPTEAAGVAVALQHAKPQACVGRFSTSEAGSVMRLPEIAFHHFPYVRADDAEIEAKFRNTASQETARSNPAWLTDVWPHLPEGRKLHMSAGWEHVWPELKVITPGQLPSGVAELPFVREKIRRHDELWREKLRQDPPGNTLIPVPTEEDRDRYHGDLRQALGGVPIARLATHLKMTYLEALWLAYWASQVPAGGKILEIGSGSGGSMGVMALASHDSVKLTSIDPFVPYDEHTHAGVVRGVMEGDEAEFWNVARHYGYAKRVRQIKKTSADAATSGSRLIDRYDLVSVDGNHSEAVVAEDLRLYWPLVKPGGLLVGHDFSSRFPGVIAATDAWDTGNVRVPYGTSLFYARKP